MIDNNEIQIVEGAKSLGVLNYTHIHDIVELFLTVEEITEIKSCILEDRDPKVSFKNMWNALYKDPVHNHILNPY